MGNGVVNQEPGEPLTSSTWRRDDATDRALTGPNNQSKIGIDGSGRAARHK